MNQFPLVLAVIHHDKELGQADLYMLSGARKKRVCNGHVFLHWLSCGYIFAGSGGGSGSPEDSVFQVRLALPPFTTLKTFLDASRLVLICVHPSIHHSHSIAVSVYRTS